MHYVLRFGHQLGAGGNRWEAHALPLSESIRLFRHAHCCRKALAAMTVVKDDGRYAAQHPRQGQGDSALSVSRVRAKPAIQQQGPREAVLVVYAVSDHSTG
ncbi:hypothetical protein [Burkholderia ubonensis]|uniref:hypothetical protein n=1 Tax=Burkholderia ubonensis TaxID=101571 RepID=UPI0018DFF1E7|nr:hypothetical protein [Burkholderia ubonensis]